MIRSSFSHDGALDGFEASLIEAALPLVEGDARVHLEKPFLEAGKPGPHLAEKQQKGEGG